MRTDLFDFDLPAASIALRPASPRDSARMLVVQPDGVLRDRAIAELPDWLEAGDQLVVNDTKVIPAQLKGRRIGRETEPKVEATLIKRLDGSRWRALVKPAKKLAPGDIVRFGNEGKVCLLGHLDAEVEAKGEEGEITLSFSFHGPALDQAIADLGMPPLPPSQKAPAYPGQDEERKDAPLPAQIHRCRVGLRLLQVKHHFDGKKQQGTKGQYQQPKALAPLPSKFVHKVGFHLVEFEP